MHFNHEWTRRNTNQEAEQPYYFWFAQARIRPAVWWGNIGGKKVFGRPLNMAHETGTFPFQLQSQGLGRAVVNSTIGSIGNTTLTIPAQGGKSET